MKMQPEITAGAHRITSYGPGYVSVDGGRLTCSFILTPEKLIVDWGPRSVAELDGAALEAVLGLLPSIVLLGTGPEQCFPPPALLAPVLAQGIGIEVMTTAAACRTYNVLAAEGRQVAAALLVP